MNTILALMIQIALNDPDAFDSENLTEQGAYTYMCEQGAEYSLELTDLCEQAKRLTTALN